MDRPRALQLVAGIALVIGWHERLAALLHALFLIPATLAAQDFWAYHGSELQGQLANFLKNVAIFGGLCFVSFRSGPGTPTSQRKATFQADSVLGPQEAVSDARVRLVDRGDRDRRLSG